MPIKEFDVDVSEKICLDIGSSTGGFTDCLLQYGAKLVYAVDVGHLQMHEKLRKDPRVMLFEDTDIRGDKPENVSDPSGLRIGVSRDDQIWDERK